MSNLMTEEAWSEIEYFKPDGPDMWGDWRKLDRVLIGVADKIRKFARRRFKIHCGWEPRAKGYHPRGMALDGHLEGLHPVEQFEIATRFDQLNGVGLYTWWRNPGIHIDVRHLTYRLNYDSRWISLRKGEYLPVTAENMRKALSM